MKIINLILILILVNLIHCESGYAKAAHDTGHIVWQGWSNEVFEQAKASHKYVLLDLEAVWCHWCHVMDKQTYSNPMVENLINSKFIAVRVDQDSRPDLSNRYQDYGWPATIIFNASGAELAKRSGYIAPEDMADVLKQIIKSPKVETVAAGMNQSKLGDSAFSPAVSTRLQKNFFDAIDLAHGGLDTDNKFLDSDSLEYAMTLAKAGNIKAAQFAKKTLAAQENLVDPVWGGVYQYSTDGDWNHPHFEKIMQIQAENMRIYSQAYLLWHDKNYLQIANNIHQYLTNFLMSPTGAFYTSQDADLVEGEHSAGYFKLADKQRRKLGVPRIDKHIYARENGWAISGLTALYAASGNNQYLNEAQRAASWVLANRSYQNGGFRHDARDVAGPYLGDTLSMGRAFLNLYAVTGQRMWLTKAQQAADFISKNFDCKECTQGGFVASKPSKGAVLLPQPSVDENVMLARFANLLYHYSGNKVDRQIAQESMRYLANPNIVKQYGMYVAGPLLTDLELRSDPLHITVIGGKSDPQAKRLFAAAIAYPSGYKRVDWLDFAEGALPNTDVEYPHLNKAAAFVCANKRCGLPVFDPQMLAAKVERFSKL